MWSDQRTPSRGEPAGVNCYQCEAHRAGGDLNVNDGCFESSPRDWISCGERFCNAHTHYCEMVLHHGLTRPRTERLETR
jgi:hypothetical protein